MGGVASSDVTPQLDHDRYSVFLKNVTLKRIVLSQAQVLLASLGQPPERLQLTLSVIVTALPPAAAGPWTVEVKTEVTGRPESPATGDTIFRVESGFTAQYDVAPDPTGLTWDTALYTAYANSSTMLHVWPYIREFCSSCTSRMGLSPVFLDTWLVPRPAGA